MRPTWTPGALQHNSGGRTLVRSRWDAEVVAYPLEERSRCVWPDRWRAIVLEVMRLAAPVRERDPEPIAGWIENGRGYEIDLTMGAP